MKTLRAILSVFFPCSVALSKEKTPVEIQDEAFATNQEALTINIQRCFEMILKGTGADKLLSVSELSYRTKEGIELLCVTVSLRLIVKGLPDVYHHSYLITKEL